MLAIGRQFTVHNPSELYTGFLCLSNYLSWYDLYSVESSVKPQINKPTGKKCQRAVENQDQELLSDAAVSSGVGEKNALDGQLLQREILNQLERVNRLLDQVEDTMAEADVGKTQKLSKNLVTSTAKKDKVRKTFPIVSDSSSDESEVPSISLLKSSKLQRRVDKRVRELEQDSQCSGNDNKYKSKRGGNIEVSVKNKVLWPHKPILEGRNRQRVSYDQLSLTQWVQGFCKNILEEKSNECKQVMISYMSDLMEDATDFSWQGAKAAHAVMLCEMECGVLCWEDSDRIDRIRRAHAQKHVVSSRLNWAKTSDVTKKPCFCKSFQSGTCAHNKEHKTNGKLHKHICAFCLGIGKQLGHPEKDCFHKKSIAKNEQVTAHL